MKKIKSITGCLIITLTAVLLIVTFQFSSAGTQPETENEIAVLEPISTELLFANAAQTETASPNFAAIYSELKDIMKKYKEAKSRNAKERLHNRTQELMGQLFDAKVQTERRRIQAAEEKLAKQKHRLAEMQSHKQDLLHKGVQKALNEGKMPEWTKEQSVAGSR